MSVTEDDTVLYVTNLNEITKGEMLEKNPGAGCEINHPRHYTAGGLEAWDVLVAKLTPEELRGYLKGNMIKYLLRANFKGCHDKDIGKMLWYSDKLDQMLTGAED